MQIEITRFYPCNYEDSPYKKAHLSVIVHFGSGSIEIPECEFYIKGDNAWIKLPNKRYTNKSTGEEGHKRLVIFDPETYNTIQSQGVEEVQRLLNPEAPAPRVKVEYSADDEIPF